MKMNAERTPAVAFVAYGQPAVIKVIGARQRLAGTGPCMVSMSAGSVLCTGVCYHQQRYHEFSKKKSTLS
jgi:hypothetical protein